MKPAIPTTSNLTLPSRVSLVEQLREVIRAELARGRWKDELPSERHLSGELLVSRPTLRRALHALQNEGILQTRQGLPCKVRVPLHRSILPRQKQVVLLYYGRIKPDLTSITTLTSLLQQQLHRRDYGLLLVDVSPAGSHSLDDSLERIDAEYRPRYYLLASVPPEVQRWTTRNNVPSLILGSRVPDVKTPAIDIDQSATMRHAVEHLVRRGHKSIGLLALSTLLVGMNDGMNAFLEKCETLSVRGISGRAEDCAARPAAIESVVRRLLEAPGKPSAIIVADLELAIGLYTTLGKLGLQIPRHVSVLSAGYWPLLDFLRPTPSSYRFSWENIANRIIRIIDAHGRVGTWPKKFWKLLPTLCEGESVRNWPDQ